MKLNRFCIAFVFKKDISKIFIVKEIMFQYSAIFVS
jgi:hypothetical protein